MTRTVPSRRITLHFSQRRFTDALTFTRTTPLRPDPTRDPTTLQVVWRQLHEDLVPGHDPNEIHPHLPGDVGQHVVAVLELDPEHRVGESLADHALHLDDVLSGHVLQTQKSACPPKRSREIEMYQNRASSASPPPSGSRDRRASRR